MAPTPHPLRSPSPPLLINTKIRLPGAKQESRPHSGPCTEREAENTVTREGAEMLGTLSLWGSGAQNLPETEAEIGGLKV